MNLTTWKHRPVAGLKWLKVPSTPSVKWIWKRLLLWVAMIGVLPNVGHRRVIHLKHLVDPAHNLMFEAHVYFDRDASGSYKGSYDQEKCRPKTGVNRVKPFVKWLQKTTSRAWWVNMVCPTTMNAGSRLPIAFCPICKKMELMLPIGLPVRGGASTK